MQCNGFVSLQHMGRAMKLQLSTLCLTECMQEQKEMLSGPTCFEIPPVTAEQWVWRNNYHEIGGIPLWTPGLIL